MNDLISKKNLIKSIDYIGTPGGIWAKPFEAYKEAFKEFVKGMPSAEPWDIVKRMLNELEQKEEKLYSDYCDATARLKAINKIAGSDQTPNRKIDGIKPLAEMEVGE